MAEKKTTIVGVKTTHFSGKSGPESIDSGLEGMTSCPDKLEEHQSCGIMTGVYMNQVDDTCRNANVSAAEEEEQVSFGTSLNAQAVSVESEIGPNREQQREEEVLVAEIDAIRGGTEQSKILQGSSRQFSEIQDDGKDLSRVSAERVKELAQFIPGFKYDSSRTPPYDSQAYVFCGNARVPVSGPPLHQGQGYVSNADVMMPLTENGEKKNWHGGVTGVVKVNPFDVRNTDVGGGTSKGLYESSTSWPLSGAIPLYTFKTYGEEFMDRFSVKVFIGGLPPDIDENGIEDSFRLFSPLVVDWPQKNGETTRFPPQGFAFLLFKQQESIKKLMSSCIQINDKLFWSVSSASVKDKLVEVRVWPLAHSEFVLDPTTPVDSRTTVFIGGLPRPFKAVKLAEIMTSLYGQVCYASIDGDRFQYPRGCGRVMFSDANSYIAAIGQKHILINHNNAYKRLEIKPFLLDNQSCDQCRVGFNGRRAIGFCADVSCLQYLCDICWIFLHSKPGTEHHIPLGKTTSAFVMPQYSTTVCFRGKFPMASSSQSIADSKQ